MSHYRIDQVFWNFNNCFYFSGFSLLCLKLTIFAVRSWRIGLKILRSRVFSTPDHCFESIVSIRKKFIEVYYSIWYYVENIYKFKYFFSSCHYFTNFFCTLQCGILRNSVKSAIISFLRNIYLENSKPTDLVF